MIRLRWLASLLVALTPFAWAQQDRTQQITPGVWFLLGDATKGYSNNIVIEMKDYLIVVDANFPGRAKELLQEIPKLSKKPVRYVFDTHAHRDHSYGNAVWTTAGATTMAFSQVVDEMNRYEPKRWNDTAAIREDVSSLHRTDAERPRKILSKNTFVLKDETREVHFYHFGWAHTQGDGFVWLPKERVLCTGDAAVNGPRNKMADGYLANWPRVLARAEALYPQFVLPGHGAAGGAEILSGQRQFLEDLYSAVAEQVKQSKTPATIEIHLPERDHNWIPDSLALDIEAAYTEISHHQPAGAVPHEWK